MSKLNKDAYLAVLLIILVIILLLLNLEKTKPLNIEEPANILFEKHTKKTIATSGNQIIFASAKNKNQYCVGYSGNCFSYKFNFAYKYNYRKLNLRFR